ncbi:MAG TPA: hypothetical protein VHW67_05750 [Solirubrobacteraceae bacterium]|nr:hypothetical protein [Solirubrobacteraceae bacterium]
MKRPELTWFQLRFPRDLSSDALLAALSALSGVPFGTRLTFDLTADETGITHRLGVTPAASETVTANLRAAIPSLQLNPTSPPAPQPRRQLLWQLDTPVAALRTGDPSAASASLLASLFPLHEGETMRLRWQLHSGPRPRFDFGSEGSRAGRTLAVRQKLALAGLVGFGELGVAAPDAGRRQQLIQRVSTSLRALSSPHGSLVADPPWLGQLLYLVARRGRHFSVSELAAVIGAPLDGVDLPGLELGASKRLVPSRSLPKRGRVLGVSDYDGREVAITPTAATRGLYVLGPVGSGKTSLLKNLIGDDLRAGRGLGVVETNGDLIQDALDLIPPERTRDVVFIDPTDRDYAVGFNPFFGSTDASLVADQLGELFQNLWQAYWGPRTGQLAHMGLLTLARRPGSTLLDLPRLYLDPQFRAAVLAEMDDPVGLEPDWRWFQALPEKEQATVIAPLLNKSRQFTARASIRGIVGQPSPALSMKSVMAKGQILLVHLPKGLIGAETAQLLGCLVLTSLWQATTERAGLPVAERHPFSLYVDEVQDFASAPIPWDEMFAQGRKYGLALTVAHQNLEQLERKLREVVLANARSKAVFALSASDARTLERLFKPALTAADLQALDAYSVAALVALDDGSTSRPVTLRTPAPPAPTGSAAAVRQASRQQFARRHDEIEAELRRRVQPPSAPVGRKRRTAV